MVFLGIYRAIYDYVPQSDNELAIKEGDLLFVIEKSADDDWWKAKKKAADESEDEPEGLIPNNYVEEATPLQQAKALYDYTRQTDEELSFSEDATLDVYDTTDPDWTLVGLDGDFGFAPSNYIKAGESAPAPPTLPGRPRAPSQPEPEQEYEPPIPQSPESPAHQSPAAALAGLLQQKTASSGSHRAPISPPPAVSLPARRPQYTPEESDEEPPPPMPRRPQSQAISPPPAQYVPRAPESPPLMSPVANPRVKFQDEEDDRLDDRSPHGPLSPAGFHLYNIHEMVSHMGKKRKMPMTLGINVPKGTIMIAPEKSRDGPQKEWTAEKMTYYSQEGKHLFMELVKPSKSIEFHCGAKDTASEIVASLGEMSGLAKAEGLREVYAAGSGTSHVQKKGQILFDFMAQGDDEVTVGIGDEVLILDDTASEEWWKVRRLKNGKVGVVPRDFVEVIETIAVSSRSGLNAGRSTVEQNRLEEDRLARQASKSHKKRDSESRAAEVGPGLALPERHSSLMQSEVDHRRTSQRGSRGNKDSPATSKPKPNSAKIRTWTDRSGSFKVEAEFIGLRDGKIHLHKLNGVKIAVPVTKMAIEDLEYVERATGVSLDEDKPLADLKRKSTQRAKERNSAEPRAGITVEKPKRPEYDWFDFFLGCGVNPQICERYSAAFAKDEMGEEILPDVNESLLRTLGLKEGDILRVMKVLDKKFNRTPGEKRGVSFGDTSVINEDGEGANGGLFSGAGGALRNNTRKGRPAPPVQTNDTVDAKAFEQKTDGAVKKSAPAESTPTPLASLPAPERKGTDGFDDNAWEVKPSRQPSVSASAPPAQAATAPAPTPAAPPPTLTGSLAELSLLSPPLQPTIVAQPAPQQAPAPQSAPPQQAAPTGAVPSLFDQLANQPPVQPPQQPSFMTQQPTGFGMPPAPSQQMSMARTRPQAPQQQSQGGSLIAPPPVRAASAPQNQQSAFGPPPLQPQLTGFQGAPNMQTQVAAPGQSLQDLTLQRNFMQQQQQMQPMQTGFPQQQQGPQGFDNFQNGLMPQPTGMNQFPQQQQSMQTSFGQPQQLQFQHPQSTGFQPQFQSPFADPPTQPFQPQPTGFNSFAQPLNPQATGINMFLPPALQPQRTGFTNGFGQQQSPPPMPPMPPMPTGIGGGNGIGGGLAPLTAQKTGPAPPVRFGTQPKAKKLVPQPTGKADLSKATPMNPFGF